MDRASGSGVFARDPDALLDLIELPVGEDLRKQEVGSAVGRACGLALRAAGKLDEVSQDDLCSEKAALEAVEAALGPQWYKDTLTAVEAAKRAAEARTAWRIDGTLREFPKFPPVNLWFDFPVHRLDESGVLADIDPEREPAGRPWGERGRKPEAKPPGDRRQKRLDALNTAFSACDLDGTGEVTQQALMEYTGKAKTTVQNWVDEHPDFKRENGVIRRVQK